MARELSPFSARRLLTQQLAQGSNGLSQRKKSPSRSRDRTSGNGPHKEPLPIPENRRPRDASRERSVKEAPSVAGRELSPEPYKKPRGSSRERRRDRSRDHTRDRSRDRRRARDGGRDKSTERKRRRPASPHQRTKKPLPSQEISFRGLDDSKQAPSKYGGAPPDKEKPNFKPTGALAKAANRVEGTKISLKYHEPPEARKPSPSQPWRIFVFKGEDVVDTIEIWQKSCWLLGRSQEVVDYLLEHPSSSGQHAVIQFRYIQKTVEDEFGVKTNKGRVKPYIIDLESSNGTELNGETVEASRYLELRDKDILKFAGSEREYVVMLPPPDKQT